MNKSEYAVILCIVFGVFIGGSISMTLVLNEGHMASWPVHVLQDTFDIIAVLVVFCFGFIISGILGIATIKKELKRVSALSDQGCTSEHFEQLVRETLDSCPPEIKKNVLNRRSEYNVEIEETLTNYEKLYHVILDELMKKGVLAD